MSGMILFIAVMAAAVIGIYFIISEVIGVIFKNTLPSTVVIELRSRGSCAKSAEAQIRGALQANPSSEIVVINRCICGETERILRKISSDHKRVHIIDA